MSYTDEELDHASSLTYEELEAMMADDVWVTCCGCRVEPDGWCPHGNHSPLLVIGF